MQSLFAPDVVIAESGGAERSFAEYACHHMPADMALTAEVQFTLQRGEIIDRGDTSEAHGEFRGRAVHARMMETVVLGRTAGEWRILHIHWSSAPISEEHGE